MQKLILRSNAWCHWCRLQVPKVGTNLAFWTWHCDWGWGSWWKQKEVSGFKQNTAWFFPLNMCLLCFMTVFSFKILERHPPHWAYVFLHVLWFVFVRFFAVPFKHRWGYSQTSLYKDIDETYFSGLGSGMNAINLPLVSQNPSKNIRIEF